VLRLRDAAFDQNDLQLARSGGEGPRVALEQNDTIESPCILRAAQEGVKLLDAVVGMPVTHRQDNSLQTDGSRVHP
jgi:hypothetical protein